MRALRWSAAALLVGLAVALPARADDDAKKVIDKAVKAHGGLEALSKNKDKCVVMKGKMHIAMGGLDATIEAHITGGSDKKFRQDIELSVNGMDFKQSVGFDGTEVWIALNGKLMRTFNKKEDLDAVRETLFSEAAAGLVLLGDKSIETAIIGESKVGETTVIGIRVSKKGRKDVSLYFEKESGLLKKIQNRGMDITSGNEVEQERILEEYKEVDGEKRPGRVVMNQDGKKFVELEITEVKLVDSIGDDIFTKPKE